MHQRIRQRDGAVAEAGRFRVDGDRYLISPVIVTDLSTVSPAGIAQIIRAVYDTEHNDKYNVSVDNDVE